MTAPSTTVYAEVLFEGFHRWDGAPPIHAYLGDRHRHRFRVRASAPVTHDDRDVEFIDLGRRVRALVREWWGDPAELGPRSCEDVARDLARALDLSEVDVAEDGENGAVHRRGAGAPLILGQAPARRTEGGPALYGSASGRRLARLLGVASPDVGTRVETLNLLQRWPGAAVEGASGDAFDPAAARRAAGLLRLGGRRLVVALGTEVARAIRARHRGLPAVTETADGAPCVVLPHPSGASRWWNAPGNFDEAAAALRSAASAAGMTEVMQWRE